MIDSLRDGDERGDRTNSRDGTYKLDLYSIPVFILEVIILLSLGFTAFFIHCKFKHEPLVTGVYCDDTAYRQSFNQSKFTDLFIVKEEEFMFIICLLIIPIIMVSILIDGGDFFCFSLKQKVR